MDRELNQTRRQQRIEEALVRLDEVTSHLARRVAADMKECPLAISPAQAHVLRMLELSGALRMSDLADRLSITQSGCTAIVDRLVETEWTERWRDPADRRVVWVALTPAGDQKLNELRRARARILAKYVSRLAPEDIDMLATLLSRAVEAIMVANAEGAPRDPEWAA